MLNLITVQASSIYILMFTLNLIIPKEMNIGFILFFGKIPALQIEDHTMKLGPINL